MMEFLLSRVLRDGFPGLWQADAVCVPARSDLRVPHIHGRVPDLHEILAVGFPLPIGGGDCVNISGFFSPPDPAPKEIMDVVPIPKGAERPIGGSLIDVITVSGEHVVLRNWHTLDHLVLLLTMSRQGIVPTFENLDMAKLGVRCDFYAEDAEGLSPFDVQFRDLTTYASPGYEPDEWSWDFGDNDTSTDRDPAHQYTGTSGDKFTVTLKVKFKNGESCTITKKDYIELT
jgi:hypothetical protein